MGYVEGGQSSATGEHLFHTFHLGGVEMGHVEGNQRGAVFEHFIHIFHH